MISITMTPRILAIGALSAFILTTVQSSSFARTPPPSKASNGNASLSLDDYLSQVTKKNDGIRSALTAADAAMTHYDEGEIMTAPQAYFDVQVQDDGKLTPPVFFPFTSTTTTGASFGFKHQSTFGLTSKLHYDLSTVTINNPIVSSSLAGFVSGGAFPFTFASASTVLELSQSLWSNGFGRSTRAQQALNEASIMASNYSAKQRAKSILSDAEMAYWRLSLARQAVRVQKEALDRAQKIYDWNQKRFTLHLGKESDVLQSEASKQVRELELTGALNEEHSAARAFNMNRNIGDQEVPETLTALTAELLDQVVLPKRAHESDAVKAAKEQLNAAAANAQTQIELAKPTLEVYGLLALNGQTGNSVPTDLSSAMAQSFSLNRPTKAIGVRFSVPLAIGTALRSRSGWEKERIAAELNYEHQVFQQDQSWVELNSSYIGTKKRLDLALKLEKIQESKLATERDLLLKGRSTTYQVLFFEQDFLLSQLQRISTQAHLFNLIAKMKLFGETL